MHSLVCAIPRSRGHQAFIENRFERKETLDDVHLALNEKRRDPTPAINRWLAGKWHAWIFFNSTALQRRSRPMSLGIDSVFVSLVDGIALAERATLKLS